MGRLIATQIQPPNANVPTDRSCVTSGLGAGAPVVTTTTTSWNQDAGGIYSLTQTLQDWPENGKPKPFLSARSYLDGRARAYRQLQGKRPRPRQHRQLRRL